MTTRRITEVTVGLSRDKWHRYRWNGGEPMPGATSILRLQDSLRGSDSLTTWAANLAVERYRDTGDPDLAVAAITEARDIGSEVHEAFDALLGGSPRPPTERTSPYFFALAAFLAIEKPEIVAREQMVANLRYRYGGTFDLAAVIRGQMALIDFKTGKGKPSFGLQLASYAMGEFIGKPDDPKQYPVPEFEAYYVLLVRPNELPDLVPVTVGNRERDHFLYLTEVYHRLKAYDRGEPVAEIAA